MQLGLGTAAIGRPLYINIKTNKQDSFGWEEFRDRGISLLNAAKSAGIAHFDTAPGYGMAEDMLLQWVRDNPDVAISTKWGYTYTANFQQNPKEHEVKDHSLRKLQEQWEVSKAFSSQLVYYQIHSATLESGVLDNEEVLTRLQEIKAKHSVKIGLTVSGANQREVIQKALDEHDSLFDSVQVTYNVLEQSLFELKDVLKYKKIIIKEALANGRIFRNERFPSYTGLYDTLEHLAKKYEVGTDAIALRYAMQQFPDAIVLSGASTLEQLNQNLESTTISLTGSDIDALSQYKVDPNGYWTERKKMSWN